MLLTITTTHRPATDLGYLLHKHPDRAQSFDVPFGAAHVFYPEASAERCTAALLLDIDPVGLVRRGRGTSGFALAEYVNDRPYVASSLLSVALVTVFKSAMAGTCKGHEQLADSAIALEASLPAVPARGGEDIVRRLFEPLGYVVDVTPIALDPHFPDWGESRHVGLTLRAELRLADLLRHLYVWPVAGVADLRLAPFAVLAAETGVFVDREHTWHLDLCDRLVAADPDWLMATGRRVVDVTDADSQAAGAAWWEQLTGGGGEGMVVKPLGFVARGRKGLVQPGIKCRGREYLRIIYGPEYADPARSTGCGSAASAASARSPCASSRSASRRSSASCAASRCIACTSASSACWRWRASPSTRDCERVTCASACSPPTSPCSTPAAPSSR